MNQPIGPAGLPGAPVYAVVSITPAMATRWLRHNTHNRPLRERVVSGYAADMRNGDWVEDGQSVKFARGRVVLLSDPPLRGGALLDGQHRLSGIVAAGVCVRMLVVTNLPDSAQEVMDTGAKRSLGDVLRLRGEPYSISLAATLMRVYLWQHGHRKTTRSPGARPTHRQLLEVLAAHPEVRRSVEVADRVRHAGGLSASTAALCHWLFNQIDPSDCAFFFGRLSDGVGLMSDDPIYALRRVLANFASDHGHGRPDDALVTALVIKGWNAYRDGRPVTLLSYRPGGSRPEPYPEPK